MGNPLRTLRNQPNLEIAPPTPENLMHADVAGNNAYFNNVNVKLINGVAPGGGGTTFPLLAPNGNVTVPSYSFAANPTTGMYWNNGLVFTVGGVDKWMINPAGTLLPVTSQAFDIGSNTQFVNNIWAFNVTGANMVMANQFQFFFANNLFGSAGAPATNLGAQGDYYFRQDASGALTHIYFKSGASTWTGIV